MDMLFILIHAYLLFSFLYFHAFGPIISSSITKVSIMRGVCGESCSAEAFHVVKFSS